MKNENSVLSGYGGPGSRITRARAAAFCANGALLPFKPPLKPSVSKTDKKKIQLGTKRDQKSYVAPTAASRNKRKRTVLSDVTNICSENSVKDCINAAKVQAKVSQRVISVPAKAESVLEDQKSFNFVPAVGVVGESVLEDRKIGEIHERIMFESQKTAVSFNVKEDITVSQNEESLMNGESTCVVASFEEHTIREGPELFSLTKCAKDDHCKDPGDQPLDYVDIDSDHANPQLCCLYSSDIQRNLRAAELLRRPSSNFMETMQRDITHSMRGILIDWLVENYVERQKLQLLGITSMSIASKYEEICAPRVEEFCFITDNTYAKGEVLKMEIQVLNFLGFQLSVPTIKTFLRRFVRAAHASYKVPPPALSHLANYLAELTLVEYSFLKFLPSAIAASAVFLARWTLMQSDHPWNRTLEHYTSYKAPDLKTTVLAMHDLQTNSMNCPLNAIREKYNQTKFESVATMTSPELLQSLFC